MPGPFHLAFPVRELIDTRHFYEHTLGCGVGRTDERWIDFNFFGHQITAHVTDTVREHHNPVDGDAVPVPHFGAVLDWDLFEDLANRLVKAEVSFIIAPRIRFQGEVGEQRTMFIRDPSGNALEFKSFKNPDRLFAT